MKKIFSFLIMLMLLSTMVFGQKITHGRMTVVDDDDSERLMFMQKQIETFQEENKESLDDCHVGCQIHVEAKGNQTQVQINRESKFMFFTVNARQTLEIDEEGNVVKQQGNLWQWMYERNWIKVNIED